MNNFNSRSRGPGPGRLSQFMFGSRRGADIGMEEKGETEVQWEEIAEEQEKTDGDTESEELKANVDYEKLTESLETLIGLYEQYKPELHPMLHKLLNKDSQ